MDKKTGDAIGLAASAFILAEVYLNTMGRQPASGGGGGGGGGTISFAMMVLNANTGDPIQGATVTYAGVSRTSGITGIVSFSSVTPGPAQISATCAGYNDWGPSSFSPQDGVTTYTIPMVPVSGGGGVPYGQSLVIQSHSETATSGTATYRNQNNIAITAGMWCIVKNRSLETIRIVESSLATIQPGASQTFSVSFAALNVGATPTFNYFCVDSNNQPVSDSSSYSVTVA